MFFVLQISSYGGKLRYTVYFDLPDDRDTEGLVKPDVRIEGSNLTIIHVSLEQPVAGVPFISEVDMREVCKHFDKHYATDKSSQFLVNMVSGAVTDFLTAVWSSA